MKELYLRAERHFVCEGGSISCLFSFYPTPQIMSLLIEWDRTWLDVGLIVCVLVCRDLMEFSNRRCLFSTLTRGASWDIGLIWESNKQDQMFVRVDVWQESRWICKHSRQTRRWISKLLENGLLLSFFCKSNISQDHICVCIDLKMCSSPCWRIMHEE